MLMSPYELKTPTNGELYRQVSRAGPERHDQVTKPSFLWFLPIPMQMNRLIFG
jgi:hypothetical protein